MVFAAMKISVIIPVYNAEKTIINTLSSVFSQSISPYEVIVVDDGSTDESIRLISRFAKENDNIKLHLIRQKNFGVSSARNRGLNAAIGDWVAFLDADDRWHPKKIEVLLPFLTEKNYVVSHDFSVGEYASIADQKLKEKKIRQWSLLIKNSFVTPSVVMQNNKEYFFDESMRYAEDHDLWLRIAEQKNIVYIPQKLTALSRPVLSSGGASANRWAMRRGELQLYKKFLSRNRISALYPLFYIYSITKHLKKELL